MTEKENEKEVPMVCKKCPSSMNIQLFGYCPLADECQKLHPKASR